MRMLQLLTIPLEHHIGGEDGIKMVNEQLDNIIERVKAHFMKEILELSNNECEYVCIALAQYFDSNVEMIRNHTTAAYEPEG